MTAIVKMSPQWVWVSCVEIVGGFVSEPDKQPEKVWSSLFAVSAETTWWTRFTAALCRCKVPVPRPMADASSIDIEQSLGISEECLRTWQFTTGILKPAHLQFVFCNPNCFGPKKNGQGRPGWSPRGADSKSAVTKRTWRRMGYHYCTPGYVFSCLILFCHFVVENLMSHWPS